MHRVLLVSLVLLWGATLAAAMEWPLWSGGVSGDFRMSALRGAPPIRWQVEATDARAAENRITLRASASGLDIRVLAVIPRDGSAGNWELLGGQIDVATWWAILLDAGLIPEMPADLKVAGQIELTGQGTLVGLQPRGEINAHLRDGSIGSVGQNWTVPQLEMTGRLELLEGRAEIRSLSLTAARADALAFGLEGLQVHAVGESPHQLRVEEATVRMLDGRVSVRPFTFDLFEPDIVATAELHEVALSQLAGLVPDALSAAQGRLSGSLDFGWNATTGLQSGKGDLQLSRDTPTTLRLAPAPGFLTQHVPSKIQWMPAIMGSLARWLALNNPAFDTLKRVEMGEMPLTVDKLKLAIYPDGPDGAVSARISVSARPSDDSYVEEVSFDISVSGPLREVLMMSTDERVNFGLKSK